MGNSTTPESAGHRTRDAEAAGPPAPGVSWLDELRNALALAALAGLYALMAGGLFHLVPASTLRDVFGGFVTGYGMAALLFVGSHAVAALSRRVLAPGGDGGLIRLAAPLVSLIAGVFVLPRLFTSPDLAALVRSAAFLGASLAFSAARGFYAGLQRRLVPARRVRDLLAERPAFGGWLVRRIGPLLAFGRLWPWLAGALLLLLLPSELRVRVAGYLLVLTYLVHLANQKLLEEVAVWVLLHALRAGDYPRAARLAIRPARLAEEIEAAPPDLEFPFAGFIAAGMQGLEGALLTPVDLKRLLRAHLAAYGQAPVAQRWVLGGGLGGRVVQSPEPGAQRPEPSLVRQLLQRGRRFLGETGIAVELEPLPLPRWRELREREARARLAALYPGESLWQVVARLYETPFRSALLPLTLLWLPLLGGALWLADRGPWALPLAGAALSFSLLLWLTLFYGNWVFDQSLRRRDFPFLARRLAAELGRGELEDALGCRDPRVRDRAVELLLFDDEIARLGITVPPAGLRKFRRRAA